MEEREANATDKFKNDFKDTIGELLNAITESNEKEYAEVSDKIVDILKKAPFDVMNPDTYNTIIGYQLRTLMGKVVEKFYDNSDKITVINGIEASEKKINIQNKNKIQFLYLEYQYLQYNIQKLIEKKMGNSMCVADRSRYILNLYREYLLTGEIRETDLGEHFWNPKFGMNEDWIDFCEGLYEAFYGNPDRYIATRCKLLDSEIRKYEHTIYRIHAFFKNGKEIIISNTVDYKPELPEAENGYYMIDKVVFCCKQNYEDYGEGFGEYFYKIPQEDIDYFKISSVKRML